ncbi:MAG: restriction endonuclease subunit S [Beijerinckiaceae bacterium]|nr:restriction endonuclease subunit S [Beijerinckiaceae bacterium]
MVPKLRFPEFRDAPAWEPVSLQKASVPVDERVGERKLTPVSISAGIGFVPQAEKFGRDISGNQYKLYTLVRDGDFVFNKGNSLKFPQGCIYLLQGWGQVAAPNVFIAFRLKDGFSNDFFQNCFEQNQHGKQLNKHITSGARSNGLLNISKETFFNVKIPTPSLPEQQKIAECLDSADALIAAQGRKVEALRAHKKGLMQQLFPQEGETQPRVRFPEFEGTGDWEEGTISDIGTVLQGYGFPERYQGQQSGDFPFYKVSDISRSLGAGKTFIEEAANYVNESQLKELRAKPIPAGTTVFAKIGEAIRSNKRAITTVQCLIDNNAAGVKAIRGKATDFFIYLTMEQISLIDHAGGVVPAVNKSAIEVIPVKFPGVEEQQRIADCLTSLDDLIGTETRKLDTLKTHKKGLMQQLFPQAGEDDA